MKFILDIGANIGKTIDVFLKHADKIVAFEPNPSLYRNLTEVYKNRAIIDGRGVSDTVGKKTFKISNANTISTFSDDWVYNSRFTNQYVWNEEVVVETTTLDNIIDEYGIPDYIKIDVEGHEFEVLGAFTKLLDNTIISFEWAEEQKNKIEETIKHIYDLGYNNFYYTEADEVLFEDTIQWSPFESMDLISKLDSNRKTMWGMIYFKK